MSCPQQQLLARGKACCARQPLLRDAQAVSRRHYRPQPCKCAAEGAQAELQQLLHMDDSNSGLSKLRFNKREQELPEELRGLQIQDGFVIDTKSDKVLNALLDAPGSFEVAIKAARGDYDQPAGVENTEHAPAGMLLSNLVSFPTVYSFKVVGKPGAGPGGKQALVEDVVTVIARHCRVESGAITTEVAERMGGKFLSIGLTVTVAAPQDIQATYEALGRDSRIKMKF